MEDEESAPVMRHFDPDCTEFQSTDEGKIIRSQRKFGVEVEMLGSTTSIVGLANSLSPAFGLEHDGSIREDMVNKQGIEVVSPILAGAAGENVLRELFARIKKGKFAVNASCGLHIHIDGKGFKNERDVRVLAVKDLKEEDLAKIIRKDAVFAVKKKLFDEFRKASDEEDSDIAALLLDEHISSNSKRLYLSKTLGYRVPEVLIRSGEIVVGKHTLDVDYYDYSDLLDLTKDEIVVSVDSLKTQPEDYVCIIRRDNALENTKTLLYLFSVFADVFMAMLPKSRRNNVYCQNLALSFSPNHIESIRSYTELEADWYKTRDLMETEGRKNNHYDDSRYYGVNLHALFAKYGTVEIRSHSATLEPNKVLYWAALHQHIMDRIVSGNITIDRLRAGAYLNSTEERTEFLLRALELRTSLRKYMTKRIAYFTSK